MKTMNKAIQIGRSAGVVFLSWSVSISGCQRGPQSYRIHCSDTLGMSGSQNSTPGYYTGDIYWVEQPTKEHTYPYKCPVRLGDLQAKGSGASVNALISFNCIRDMVISKVTSTNTLEPFNASALTQTTQNAQQNQGEGEGEDQQQRQGDGEENQEQQQAAATQSPTLTPETEEVTYGYLKIDLAPGTQTKNGKTMKYLGLPLNETIFPQLKGLREIYTQMSKNICNDKDVAQCIIEEENKWLLPPEPVATTTATTPPTEATPPIETDPSKIPTYGKWMFSNLFSLEASLPDLKSAQEQFASAQKFPYDETQKDDHFLSIPTGVNKLAWTTAIKKLSIQITTPVIGKPEVRINTLKATIEEIKVMWDQIKGSMFKLRQTQPQAGSSAFVFDEEKYFGRVKILYKTDAALVKVMSTEIKKEVFTASHAEIPANVNVFSDLTTPTITFPYLPWMASMGNRALSHVTGSILMVDHIPIAAFHSEGQGASFKPAEKPPHRERTGEKATHSLADLPTLQPITIAFNLGTTALAAAEKKLEEDTSKLPPLEEKLAKANGDKEAAELQKQQLQKEKDALEAQLEEARAERQQDQATYQANIAHFQEKLDEKNDELKEATTALNAANTRINTLQTEVNGLKETMEGLRRDIRASADALKQTSASQQNFCM